MAKRMIKAITFDLDNTLWDVEPVLLRAEQALYQWLEENRPRVTREFDGEALRDFRFRAHRSHPELAHQISKIRIHTLYEVQIQCGYSEQLAREGAQTAFDAFLRIRHKVQPYERALDVLEALAERYVLGALSNGNADIYKTDIGEYFDFAFSAEQLDASKPLPDMFHAAIQESGAVAREIVHVGDNPEHDILGAQQVGMFTVWMNSGGWRWPEHRVPADEAISALEDLPAAIRRIESRSGHE